MRVLVVDDDKLVAASLKTILSADTDISVVATGSSGREAIALFRLHRPDVLLMDIRMDGMTGIEAAQTILQEDPKARILFLTTFSDDDYILQAFRMGARGYLLKQHFDSIVPSVKAVCLDQRVFGDEIIERMPALMKEKRSGLAGHGLTEKEMELVTLVADGRTNREIAETLFLSEGTVRNYLSVILEKLSLRDRTQLAIFYYRNA